MPVTHIVLLQFAEGTEPSAVKEATQGLLALKTSCIHPASQTPYILSIKGGKDNSPEGHQGGITHGFVVEFATAADRDYYVATDPAHQAYIKSLGGQLAKVVVVDFTDGEW